MTDVTITADLAGRVLSIAGQVGDSIAEGDEIVVIEAMKMEIPVAATAGGKIKSILVAVDAMVEEGQPLLVIES
jgi:biotin carboxyl carrier protein